MANKRNKATSIFLPLCVFAILFAVLYLSSGNVEAESATGSLFHIRNLLDLLPDRVSTKIVPDESLHLEIKAEDEGETIFYSKQGYYRYGPSIIEYEDGSYDAWFSAPGNNSTQWDWITYRHSDDGENWSKEKIILKPTEGSRDQCSVCDPGVIYFNGYYYLGYTSTDDYGRKGFNNSMFVARSENPDGPYEKWNGSGWGGKPQPIIEYDGDPKGWGIGEPSFVLMGNELYIYYTYFDTTGGYTSLARAEVGENWPETIEEKGAVLGRTTQDSLDVFYADDYKVFMAFSIENRMSESSEMAIYVSTNGQEFEHCDSTKKYIEDYAHNMGIAKGPDGHQRADRPILAGYAYGKRWGRWNAKFQHINISNQIKYKITQ